MKKYYVYIIQARRTSKKHFGKWLLYTGLTNNPKRRLTEHIYRIKSRYMRRHRILPSKMLYCEELPSFQEARKREREIKRLTQTQKLELIASHKNIIKKLDLNILIKPWY